MTFEKLRKETAAQQKKGLPFILASCCIWFVIILITFFISNLFVRNILTLSCGALILPLSLLWSKILKVNLFQKTALIPGLLLATNNQMLYLFICLIALAKSPALVLPIYAIIYGAHLLPYSFLYGSKSYQYISLLICFGIMLGIVVLRLPLLFIPIFVMGSVLCLAGCLYLELRVIFKESKV